MASRDGWKTKVSGLYELWKFSKLSGIVKLAEECKSGDYERFLVDF